jgi:hypothetical protein
MLGQQLNTFTLSDRLTLNSAGEEERGALAGPMTPTIKPASSSSVAKAAGRTEMAASGRLAFAPALKATPGPCQEALDRFSPGYGVGELRLALIDFSPRLDQAMR